MEAVKRSNQGSKERMLSLVQRVASAGLFEWKFESGEIRWTPELEQLYGIKPGSFGGTYRDWLTHIHPDDLPLFESMMAQWRTFSGPSHPFECRIVRPNGEVRWIEACAELETDEQGNSLGLLGCNLDITERRLIAQALQGERLFLRKVIDAVPSLIAVKDSDGRFLLANESAAQALGVSTEEIVGKTYADCLLSFDSGLPREQQDLQVILNRRLVQSEISIGRRKGLRSYLSITKGPLISEDGSCDKVLIVATDITDRKRAEEEKAQLEAQAQRAHRLESIGTLAGGIAHDFNNLLAGLFGYLELARAYLDTNSTAKADSTIGKALSVFDRAKDLTRQLLTFAKGGAPAKKIEDISKPINDTVAFALSGSNVAGRVVLPVNLWPCKIDKNQIGQALDNILINAKEAMPEGGTVLITAENISENSLLPKSLLQGNYVRISVADQGRGIPREAIEHVFDPFFTTKDTGHGLGLSIAYSIVKRHGGTIEIDSIQDQGTTVSLFLPASPESAVPEAPWEVPSSKAVKGKILLMDDEQMVQDVVGTMLEGLGYSVGLARDGAEAIRLYQEGLKKFEPFDVVILDLTVRAGMGGVEAIQRLLEMDPQAQVVVSSGYSNDPVLSNPQAHGFKAALAKPFQSQELDDLLQKLIGEAPVSWLRAI